ncbi:MAG TPA: hypothetical protein VEW25_02835 [Allosphingosinicella sp.]|nr:hypothetical protein [Allosphingosinicella sp.]
MLSVRANRRLAFAIGILLPLAETARRSGDLASWWLWIDDWLIGGALVLGAWAAGARRAGGLRALAAAWGLAAGMGYYSLVGHLLRVGEEDVSGLPGWTLVAVIGLGWLLVLYALASTLLADRR